MNKERLNTNILCGGRTSGKTYEQFLKIYEYAKENGYKEINVTFIEPELYKLQQENKELQERIDKAIEYINIVGIKTDKPKYFQMIKDTIWGEELLDILKDSDTDE